MPVLFVYYVYDNPTYEVANKLICISYNAVLVAIIMLKYIIKRPLWLADFGYFRSFIYSVLLRPPMYE